MDTYIPSGPGTGILGTKAGEGELDGIQAFKKGMKAGEHMDAPTSEDFRNPEELEKLDKPSQNDAASMSQPSENALDEIQLFKLMMKKEQSHKTQDTSQGPAAEQVHNESALRDIKDTSRPPPQSSKWILTYRGLNETNLMLPRFYHRYCFPSLTIHIHIIHTRIGAKIGSRNSSNTVVYSFFYFGWCWEPPSADHIDHSVPRVRPSETLRIAILP